MKEHWRTALGAFLWTAIVVALALFLLGRAILPAEAAPVSLSDALRLLFENDRSNTILPSGGASDVAKDSVLTLLLLGLDYRPEDFDDYRADAPATPGALGQHTRQVEADFIAVLCVDTTGKTIDVITIPEDTVLTVSGRQTTLKEVWGELGEEYFCQLIASLIGFAPDYRLAVNVSDVGALVELAGNAIVTVPCNMYLENDLYTATPHTESAMLLFEAGDRYITKENAKWLLSFDDYSGGGSRASTILSFINALMTRFTSLENLLRIDELYTAALRSVHTDVTIEDVREHISVLLSYASYTVRPRTYPGVYSADREQFLPDKEAALTAFSPYR